MRRKRLVLVVGSVVLALIVLAGLLVVAGWDGVGEQQAQLVGWSKWHNFHTSAVTNANGVAMGTEGLAVVGVQVEGVVTATVGCEGSIDGSTYYGLQWTNLNDGSVSTSTTADGLFSVPVLGVGLVRCPVSSYAGGTIVVRGDGMPVGGASLASVALGAGSATIGKLAANTGVDVGDVDVLSIAAGEAHLGEIGGNTISIQAAPTVSTTGYVAGKLIGGKLSFANASRVAGGTGVIFSMAMVDLDKQDAMIDLVLFSADPASTTFTDNAAWAVADADVGKICGVVDVVTTDYDDWSDNSAATISGLNIGFDLASGTTLYGALVARGTVTFTSTANLTTTITILRD